MSNGQKTIHVSIKQRLVFKTLDQLQLKITASEYNEITTHVGSVKIRMHNNQKVKEHSDLLVYYICDYFRRKWTWKI